MRFFALKLIFIIKRILSFFGRNGRKRLSCAKNLLARACTGKYERNNYFMPVHLFIYWCLYRHQCDLPERFGKKTYEHVYGKMKSIFVG